MLGFVRAGVGLSIAPRSGVESFLGKELVAAPVRGRPLARDPGIIRLTGGVRIDGAHSAVVDQVASQTAYAFLSR
jgi:DNA-binding transcriptional LysR family regulator